ncbi:MAG: two-component sensor histidine kinase [Anaerolineaceae bacterium]|nr:two-component sensor histidine kinase [Anaerolineaceae bacterium]
MNDSEGQKGWFGRRRREQIGILAVILSIFAVQTAIFTVVYLLTGLVFGSMQHPPTPLAIQIINTILGLLIGFFTLAMIGRVFGSKQRAARMGIFNPIIEAMNKIAKGDFSVQLDDDLEGDGGIINELAKSVNTMAVELNQMEQMRQEFISNVSHEIQSPITSIRGFAQALQNNHMSVEDRNHYLSIIETESVRISRITENLLKLATLEAESVRFEPKTYSLDRQIRTLILACEPQWTDKKINMDVSLDDVTIMADEDLLSQVWMNLISNSIKFTPEGGNITVDLNQQGNHVAFKIADSGIGISDEDQQHVFERFFKADKSRTRAHNSGSGLGLSIVQKIVDMHHGTISVESKIGIGTTFIVNLPLAEAPKASPIEAEQSAA